MRIIIVGAGKLGYSIAELLSKEEYDVIVIDQNDEQLEAIRNNLDVLTITANGASPVTMNHPDVRGADILIAVTESDEINMVACMMAKKHNVTYTIARIRDTQFLGEGQDFLKSTFDIDLTLNPDLIMANEIHRIIMMPMALNVEEFANGKVQLIETKIQAHSPLINTPLQDLPIPPSILIGLIFRNHQMLIPHGNDILEPLDNVFFIGDPETLNTYSKNFMQNKTEKVNRVMIIGAGRTGRYLASMLDQQNVEVKIIDTNRERCRLVAEKLDNGIAICGDGTNIDLLTEEGIENADMVVCLTTDDKLNLMLALLAKQLGATKTIVRVNRNEYVDLMEKVGVDIALSSRLLSASEVLAFVRSGGVVSISLLEGAKAEAVEVIVQQSATVAGKPLAKADLPRECLVCACVRDNKVFIPNGNSVLQVGDRAILFTATEHSKKVMTYFQGRP
jgi:trk system potassium uptake protein TrkA